ncbi:hypothetical protein GCK72_020917 [Caenorhabditis remanei]|uniref:SXP/RAL-2 family protein Ani s 5-like cation-binding domain-containing protein n=1 Tax=Caenorhabditis remanei TaxID=31234 RepID=E3MBC2_CAERE|nr:hypothetical protein GCK72_020917 [Caenorhabditis remanei]EFO97796.1 hypothetical protein CRE_15884 [Caenorhabditis remanei]KAF1754357.1 hypothetical protein GCK72_020917 [Caenorhabditis remanei]
MNFQLVLLLSLTGLGAAVALGDLLGGVLPVTFPTLQVTDPTLQDALDALSEALDNIKIPSPNGGGGYYTPADLVRNIKNLISSIVTAIVTAVTTVLATEGNING